MISFSGINPAFAVPNTVIATIPVGTSPSSVAVNESTDRAYVANQGSTSVSVIGLTPPDSDGDGVIDTNDLCPATPAGATVDVDGCPIDSDGDGVYDGLDICPGFDDNIDTDGDGTPDGCDATPYGGMTAISIDDVSLVEGDSGKASMSFTVTKSGTGPATVDFTTSDGTATMVDSDYIAKSGKVSFGPNALTKTIDIKIQGDKLLESDENFIVYLSNCVGCLFIDEEGSGTILNDDVLLPEISIDDVSQVEGDSGKTDFVFTVTRTGDLSGTSSLSFNSVTHTATLRVDYDNFTTGSNTLNFVPGQAIGSITVRVIGDTIPEPDENFGVRMKNCVDCTFVDTDGLGTILNDDSFPEISIDDVSQVEGDRGRSHLEFTVTRSGNTDIPSTITFGISPGGTATQFPDRDFIGKLSTLKFGIGSTEKTFFIKIVGDTKVEPDEYFNVGLSRCVDYHCGYVWCWNNSK